MKTNAPKKITLLIAVILAVVAVIGLFVTIPFITGISFWLLTAGFVVLLAGCLFKGL